VLNEGAEAELRRERLKRMYYYGDEAEKEGGKVEAAAAHYNFKICV
jgi:hypothetical protein